MRNIGITRRALVTALLAASLAVRGAPAFAQNDPLPSWNDGATKTSIVEFVSRVTKAGGADFVPPAERIATFDNDGTLWCEQSVYVEVVFAIDRVRAVAPEWHTRQPFKAVLEEGVRALGTLSARDLLEVITAGEGGTTTQEFAKASREWLASARHPRFKRRYTDLVYQPMLELLAYLRANDFKIFIVSGGSTEFMRGFTGNAYGIPPEQVVGTSGGLQFKMPPGGPPVLINLPRLDFIDDGPGKPVGIFRSIGRRPIFAFGNSDGDLQMLEWTAAGPRARFMGLVHHTDGTREYAYDRESKVGRLDKALDAARANGWTVVDMKKDWRVIFPFQK